MDYTAGQVVKGRNPPKECPVGFYWRKVMGLDEFKLYPKKERQMSDGSPALDGEAGGPRVTITRVAAGVRHFMQNEEGFNRVMEAANLSLKAIQNLATWSTAAATVKAEQEKVRLAAVTRANTALRDAGLMIGPDGKVQPIPPA
jgi:hypothetical protein